MISKGTLGKKTVTGLLLVTALISLAGCKISNEQTDRPFNSLGRSVQLDLLHEGYVIGIEKRSWEEIGNPSGKYEGRFIPLPAISDTDSRQNTKFKAVTNDTKGMVITHIASFFEGRQFLYNAYSKFGEEQIKYERGFRGLDDFKDDLLKRLIEARQNNFPYTHLFILVMGWNNDQHKSIWRYNQLLNHLKEVAEMKETSFRPLAITFTWPSVWKAISDSWMEKKFMGHAGSYFNKANDADEIGFTIANWILNKQLNEIKLEYGKENFPFVTGVGHSFGARLIATAMDSPQHLADPPLFDTPIVDLFIGLQGAFSINRFISGKGIEGSLYENFRDWRTRIILTSSTHDSATPIARYTSGASHVGGKFGLALAIEHPDIFDVKKWNPNSVPRFNADKVAVLDCESIISGDQAHNDVFDIEMAKLIWSCIDSINPTP